MNYKDIVNNIYIILVESEHPGNIGSVARAMKNMGLSKLILVNPVPFTKETYWLAHASEDIVDNAMILPTLEAALESVDILFGTSNKLRKWKNSHLIRDIASEITELAVNRKMGIVFGREKDGLTKEELNLCERIINIPAYRSYPSYNLSQAVLIVLYELFCAGENIIEHPLIQGATINEKNRLAEHFYRTLEAIKYFPKQHLRAWKSMTSQFREFLHDSGVSSKQIRVFHKYFKEITNFSEKYRK